MLLHQAHGSFLDTDSVQRTMKFDLRAPRIQSPHPTIASVLRPTSYNLFLGINQLEVGGPTGCICGLETRRDLEGTGWLHSQ